MSIRTPLIALAALAVLAPSAQAVVVQNDTFNSGYTVGDLDGQNGYDAFTYTETPWNVNATAGVGGSYGVTWDSAPDSGAGTNFVFRSVNYATTAANPILTASVDVASKGFATGVTGTTSSLFGFGIFNSAGAGLGSMLFQFAVGSTTAATVYFAGGDATTYTSVATTGGLNTFKTLSIRLDTVANTESFLVNGVSVGTASYTASDAVIGDVDLAGYASGYDTGAYDNLTLNATQPVPEPTTIAALGLGAVAMLRRRKRA